MPDGFDIAQRGSGGRPPGGGPSGGGPSGGRPPQRPPIRRFPRFRFFPIVFPRNRCEYIDRFGRCCDRFGRCCDRFGRCSFSGFYGGYPLTGAADSEPVWYDGGWDTADGSGDWGMAVFNEMDSGWDDQY